MRSYPYNTRSFRSRKDSEEEIAWNLPARSGRTRLFLSRAAAFVLLVLTVTHAYAQKEMDYGVHANIIYHFTKYIDWPDEKKTGDFVIGVLGNSPIYDELKTNLANKKVGKQKIVIKQIVSSSSSLDCHILFVGDDESYQVKKIGAKTAGKPTLLVSETEGLAKKGFCINFIIVSDKLKLEINKNNIENRNLSIASELLKLGIPVN